MRKHFDVTFVTERYFEDDAHADYRYVQALQKLGVTVLFKNFKLENVLQNDFDVIIFEFFDTALRNLAFVKKIRPDLPVIIDTVDVHFARELQMAEVLKSEDLLRKALETKSKELKVYGDSDVIWTVTDHDRQILLKENPQLCVNVIPNIHKLKPINRNNNNIERNTLLFIGGFWHQPNEDAVLFFHEKIFPHIRKEISEAKLIIVGNSPTEKVKALASESVQVVGWVPETEPYLQKAHVSIVPLRYGAGLKGKVGEAMMSGLPIVTTSVGIQGMDVTDGVHLLVADAPIDFANKTIQLLKDVELQNALSKNAYDYIRTHYTPEIVEEKLLLSIGKAINTRQLREEQINVTEKRQDHVLSMEDGLPFVSIIVPVFNSSCTLDLCIQALLNQNYPKSNYEIIMVDNNSTDDSVDIIKKYPVSLYFEKKKQTSYAARNQGIKNSKGEILCFTDSDCITDNNWIAELVKCFSEPNIGGIGGPILAYEPTTQVEKYIDENSLVTHSKKTHFLPFAATANAAYRRIIFEEAGLFEDKFITGSDMEMSWRMQSKTHFSMGFTEKAIIFHKHRTNLKDFTFQRRRNGLASIIHATMFGINKEYPNERYSNKFIKQRLSTELKGFIKNFLKVIRIIISKWNHSEVNENILIHHIDRLSFIMGQIEGIMKYRILKIFFRIQPIKVNISRVDAFNVMKDSVNLNKMNWQTRDIENDKTKNLEYNKMVGEEITEYKKVPITKELKLGGIHDQEAWHYYWRHVDARVKELLGNKYWYQLERNANRLNSPKILSLGCGHGGYEIALAKKLQSNYEIIGLDLNEDILKKAAEIADKSKLNIKFNKVDLNYINLPKNYFDIVYAQASLHHVINLEHLFHQVYDALKDKGQFFVADIIGKNRVILWDENLEFINKIILDIPESYRKDKDGRIVELIKLYANPGMEGIRQEEILGQLLKIFRSEFLYLHNAFIRFIATHPIIGENLSANIEQSQQILNHLISEDDDQIEKEKLRPTEMLGIFRVKK
ncbi:MAG: glycosyltransferase [Bacteroidota bacterium]|nr:glycosyltransferase [Bacteroidota bacterium]